MTKQINFNPRANLEDGEAKSPHKKGWADGTETGLERSACADVQYFITLIYQF